MSQPPSLAHTRPPLDLFPVAKDVTATGDEEKRNHLCLFYRFGANFKQLFWPTPSTSSQPLVPNPTLSTDYSSMWRSAITRKRPKTPDWSRIQKKMPPLESPSSRLVPPPSTSQRPFDSSHLWQEIPSKSRQLPQSSSSKIACKLPAISLSPLSLSSFSGDNPISDHHRSPPLIVGHRFGPSPEPSATAIAIAEAVSLAGVAPCIQFCWPHLSLTVFGCSNNVHLPVYPVSTWTSLFVCSNFYSSL